LLNCGGFLSTIHFKKMDSCSICTDSKFTRYWYGNHLSRINRSVILFVLIFPFRPLAFMLRPILKYLFQGTGNSLFFHAFERMVLGHIFSPFHYIQRCEECGYGVYVKNVSKYKLLNYYSSVYSIGKENLRFSIKEYLNDNRALGQFNFIKEEILGYRSIHSLDIGAAGANISLLIRNKLKNESKVKIDVIEAGSSYTKYYKQANINCLARYFPASLTRTYDLVIGSHWLEHVGELDSAMTALTKVTKKGGLIFIEVPNCNDEYFDCDGLDKPHIHFFTENSLIRLFKKYGFKLLRIGQYGFTNKECEAFQKDRSLLSSATIENNYYSDIHNKEIKGGHHIRSLFKYLG